MSLYIKISMEFAADEYCKVPIKMCQCYRVREYALAGMWGSQVHDCTHVDVQM